MIRLSTLGLYGIICAALAGCTSTATRVSTSYYEISGSTGAELDREITSKGPLEGHALASTAIRFVPVAVEYHKTSEGCSYKTADFRVNAKLTLPRWREHLRTRDANLRIAWRHLSDYARAHEETHVQIAEKHAKLIADALLKMKPRPTCDKLDAEAEKVIAKGQRAHDREQNRFDAAEQKRLARYFES